MRNFGIVSLLTDFGYADEYVGVMKAVILSHSPSIRIVDICHTVPPQDIPCAARMLEASFPFFPDGSVHLAVVDPGVGTERDILVATTRRHIFIAPDNGLLTTVLQSPELKHCYRLATGTITLPSNTFHGRDIMAPAAGKIAAGTPASELGDELDPEQCIILAQPFVQITEKEIIGEVIAVDHFGNIATSIKAEHLPLLSADVEIEIEGHIISGMVNTYAEVARHTMTALIDSRGYLEIAMNQGSAAQSLGIRRGDKVVVRSVTRNSPQ